MCIADGIVIEGGHCSPDAVVAFLEQSSYVCSVFEFAETMEITNSSYLAKRAANHVPSHAGYFDLARHMF